LAWGDSGRDIICQITEYYSAEGFRGCAAIEGRQPEPAASVAGGGSGRDDRGAAAKIGGLDRQTLRGIGSIDFTPPGPEGLFRQLADGPSLACSGINGSSFARIVESRTADVAQTASFAGGRSTIKRVIAERLGSRLSLTALVGSF